MLLEHVGGHVGVSSGAEWDAHDVRTAYSVLPPRREDEDVAYAIRASEAIDVCPLRCEMNFRTMLR
jgi:hypothetical protein